VNLGLLWPAGLAALVSLLLPLALHLSRRTDHRTTLFAALRWLEVRQRPRRHLQLEERSLLALRLLLLAALALLLAQPVRYAASGGPDWVVVVPGIDRDAALAALAAPSAQWHWLAPGFPALEMDPPEAGLATSSLLRELDSRLRDDVGMTVLVPAKLGGLDGQRPSLRRKVDWRVIGTDGPAATPERAPPPTLVVRDDKPDDPALRFLEAAAVAWSAPTGRSGPGRADIAIAPPSEPIGSDARWLVWLVPGELPPSVRNWIASGGVALLGSSTSAPGVAAGSVLWRSASGEVLARGRAFGDGRIMQLSQELEPARMPELLAPTFPDRLRSLFDPPPAPTVAFAETQWPPADGPRLAPAPRPLTPWLALLVAILFLAERWLATSAARERSR
jgi:hypothetical protein